MKLELKHLAPYLPYELQIKTAYGIKTMVSLSTTVINYDLELEAYWDFIKDIKPILRPLSDLTKEIEHNGEKFVPIEILNKMLFTKHSKLEYYDSEFCNGAILFSTKIAGFNILSINEKLQKLIEWHFDIFGLIEKGLAINTFLK